MSIVVLAEMSFRAVKASQAMRGVLDVSMVHVNRADG